MLSLQLQQALKLPKHQRAELAIRLLTSLEQEDEPEPVVIANDRDEAIAHLRAKLAARR